MKVVIAGESPFVGEVGQLCLNAGHDTIIFLVEDFIGALQSGLALENLSAVDVVIEMHHESADTKQELLFAIGNTIRPTTLVLSSALTTSATRAAAWTDYAERVVGFGVLPPLDTHGIVEVAAALQTAPMYFERAAEFWQSCGYRVQQVADGPGLVRARIICCLINEAATAVQAGVATAADIDRAIRLGTNYPYGPLAWGDHLGIDTVLGVMRGLFEEWGEDRYRPAPLLKRMVLAGRLGKKSGEGFFRYE